MAGCSSTSWPAGEEQVLDERLGAGAIGRIGDDADIRRHDGRDARIGELHRKA